MNTKEFRHPRSGETDLSYFCFIYYLFVYITKFISKFLFFLPDFSFFPLSVSVSLWDVGVLFVRFAFCSENFVYQNSVIKGLSNLNLCFDPWFHLYLYVFFTNCYKTVESVLLYLHLFQKESYKTGIGLFLGCPQKCVVEFSDRIGTPKTSVTFKQCYYITRTQHKVVADTPVAHSTDSRSIQKPSLERKVGKGDEFD